MSETGESNTPDCTTFGPDCACNFPALSADARAVLDWLRADIERGGGSGRRPSRIQMGLGWYLEDEERVGPAILELIDAHLVALHYVQGMTALGPYVCPLLPCT